MLIQLPSSRHSSFSAYMVDGCTNTFTLYLSFLSSCPRLVAVDLSFSSTKELNAVFHAIELSLDTLKSVNLVQRTGWRVDNRFAEEALRHRQLKHIEGLVIDNVEIDYRSRLYGSLAIPLRSLRIRIKTDMESYHVNVWRLLPEDRATLRQLSLDIYGIELDTFVDLLSSLPTQLEILDIQCQHDGRQPLASCYSRIFVSSPIPIEGFNSLTSLSHLTLKSFQGPSLSLLDTLCASSPNLVCIDFTRSVWVANPAPSNPSMSISDPNRIFPELGILTNLRQLYHLRYLHLGYLPTIDSSAYPILTQEMKERNVRLEWAPSRA
ncbi:hypothetical protein JCM5353_006927 [Sporobolomyces roseus]